MPTCDYCGTSFDNSKALIKHLPDCQDTGGSLSSQVLRLENQKKFFHARTLEMEKSVEKLKKKNIELLALLKLERLKSNIYLKLISEHTELDPSDYWDEDEKGVNVFSGENGAIPVIVHEHLKGNTGHSKKYSVNTEKPKRGKTYRTVKQYVELAKEESEEQEKKLKEVKETLQEISHQNFDVSHKDVNKTIEEQFAEISKSRVFKKHLETIRENRIKLLGTLDLGPYIELLKTHIKRCTAIFKNKKKRDKDIIGIVSNMLTPLDQRLVFYGKYFNTTLETDEIQRLKLCLKVNANHTEDYTILDRPKLYERFHIYGVCIFTIKELVKRYLINPYGRSSVVYLRLPNSTDDDPYSFYSLETIEKHRGWKMELRLEDFSRQLSRHIKQYCVLMFRRIYFDVFNDNTYRDNFADSVVACHMDCEQILQNIFDLSRAKKFCNLLRKMVIKHATIQPTEKDKFDLQADDRHHKKQFCEMKDNPDELTSVVQELFDDISDEDAMSVWQNRISLD